MTHVKLVLERVSWSRGAIVGREIELFVSFYEAAREEISKRIELRDRAVFAYVVTMGAYLAFIISQNFGDGTKSTANEIEYDILLNLFVPAISLAAFCIIVQHQMGIRYLAYFITETLYPQMKRYKKKKRFRMWDKSYSQAVYAPMFRNMYLTSHLGLMCAPIIYFWFVFIPFKKSQIVMGTESIILTLFVLLVDIVVIYYLLRMYYRAVKTNFDHIRKEIMHEKVEHLHGTLPRGWNL